MEWEDIMRFAGARLQELLAWQCCGCEGPLDDDCGRLSGLCGACRLRLPRMIAPVCGICGISLSSEDGLCLRCRDSGEALPGVGRLRSACLYVGVGQDLIQAYKAEGCRSLAWLWAGLLAPLLRELREPGALLMPVPSRGRNRLARGFDPVESCLRRLPADLGAARAPARLVRSESRNQKDLDRAGRWRNLEGCIRLHGRLPPGSRVLLVDDVCTTGATLSACAAELRRCGCSAVDAVTLFRD
jgi:predicted amidophosphoribosyltransferase